MGHDMGGRVDPHGEALVWCMKCSELYAVPSGTETFEPLQAGKERHGKVRKNVENHPQARRGKGARQERGRMESRRGKKSHWDRVQEAEGGI